MGQLDLFVTRMSADSTWTEPKNLGYPINTSGDEMGLVIEAGGDIAYFSSKRIFVNLGVAIPVQRIRSVS